MQPKSARARMTRTTNSLRIEAPSTVFYARLIPVLIFGAVWFFMWTLGTASAGHQFFMPASGERTTPIHIAAMFLLIQSTIVLGCVILFLWVLFGKEIVQTTKHEIEHRRQLFWFSSRKYYHKNSIQELHIQDVDLGNQRMPFWQHRSATPSGTWSRLILQTTSQEIDLLVAIRERDQLETILDSINQHLFSSDENIEN